ncbi:hypothetical protein, partial [Haloferula rosea]|uniref:hypothetical protein n=1 Tax=Haloferula rosea TaxID=490093 RepID=UPI001F277B97
AERLAKAGLEWMRLPLKAKDLVGRGRWLDEKAVLASLIRARTGVRNAWVADRLGMGTEGNVTRAVRRVREEKRLGRMLKDCERMLEKRD